MKSYYDVLGISVHATAAEIRRAYRKLVQYYHPDVNPSPEAHERMAEINEAYEVLGDVDKRTGYDFLLSNPQVIVTDTPPASPAHRDPAYRKRAYRPAPKESASQQLIRQLIPYVSKIAWVGCLTCLLLLVDRLLPERITTAVIVDTETTRVGRTTRNHLETESGRRYKISDKDWELMKHGVNITIHESRLLGILVTIDVPEKFYRVTNLSTIYRNFFFVPCILLILSVSAVLIRNAIEIKFNLGIVISFVLIFTWILILK